MLSFRKTTSLSSPFRKSIFFSIVFFKRIIFLLLLLNISCNTNRSDAEQNQKLITTLGILQASNPNLFSSIANLQYQTRRIVFPTNSTVNLVPNFTGIPLSFTSNNPLPAGLALNANTGVINGSPVQNIGRTEFTITASGPNQTSTQFKIFFSIAADTSTYQCNDTGTAFGCNSSAPFTCGASNKCYPTLSQCHQGATCTASVTSQSCNTSGVFAGCSASQPFSCPADGKCYNTLADCRSSQFCNPL